MYCCNMIVYHELHTHFMLSTTMCVASNVYFCVFSHPVIQDKPMLRTGLNVASNQNFAISHFCVCLNCDQFSPGKAGIILRTNCTHIFRVASGCHSYGYKL